ncbi:N-acetylmuramoyl-L-alanine amidase, partial [Planococcus antarcticus DSM 14505]
MLKIALDAGHGGKNSTPGKRSPDGEYEWNFNNKVL